MPLYEQSHFDTSAPLPWDIQRQLENLLHPQPTDQHPQQPFDDHHYNQWVDLNLNDPSPTSRPIDTRSANPLASGRAMLQVPFFRWVSMLNHQCVSMCSLFRYFSFLFFPQWMR